MLMARRTSPLASGGLLFLAGHLGADGIELAVENVGDLEEERAAPAR